MDVICYQYIGRGDRAVMGIAVPQGDMRPTLASALSRPIRSGRLLVADDLPRLERSHFVRIF